MLDLYPEQSHVKELQRTASGRGESERALGRKRAVQG